MKPSNILLFKHDHGGTTLELAKLGQPKLVSNDQQLHTTYVRTLFYAASELFTYADFARNDVKDDIYSVGIIMLESFYPTLDIHELADLLNVLKTAKGREDLRFPDTLETVFPECRALLFNLVNEDTKKAHLKWFSGSTDPVDWIAKFL